MFGHLLQSRTPRRRRRHRAPPQPTPEEGPGLPPTQTVTKSDAGAVPVCHQSRPRQSPEDESDSRARAEPLYHQCQTPCYNQVWLPLECLLPGAKSCPPAAMVLLEWSARPGCLGSHGVNTIADSLVQDESMMAGATLDIRRMSPRSYDPVRPPEAADEVPPFATV